MTFTTNFNGNGDGFDNESGNINDMVDVSVTSTNNNDELPVYSVLTINGRSIQQESKRRDLGVAIEAHGGCTILGITETWFKKHRPDGLCDIDGYYLAARIDRQSDRKGGGAALYIKNGIESHSASSGHFSDQVYWCQVTVGDVIFALFYRTPQCKRGPGKQMVERMRKLACKDVCIFGDLNMPSFDWSLAREFEAAARRANARANGNANQEEPESDEEEEEGDPEIDFVPAADHAGIRAKLHERMKDLILDYGLYQRVEGVTRLRDKNDPGKGGTLLDVFLTKDNGPIMGTPEIHTNYSNDTLNLDHFPVSAFVRIKPNTKPRKIKVRQHFKFEKEGFELALCKDVVDTVLDDVELTLEDKAGTVTNTIVKAYTEVCPLKERVLKTKRPWADRDLNRLFNRVKEKKKKARELKRTPRPWTKDVQELYTKYNKEWDREWKKATAMNKRLKDEYLETIMQDRNKYYALIKAKKGGNAQIGPLLSEGKLLREPEEIAETLTKQYLSNSVKDDDAPEVDWNLTEEERETGRYLEEIVNDLETAKEVIKNLKPKAAPGEDELQGVMIQLCGDDGARWLVKLTQMSVNILGRYPKNWGNMIITPVLKAGSDRSVPKSWRPVALNPVLAKCVEAMVATCLRKYFEKHNLLDKQQHGYRPGHSVDTNLMWTWEEITVSADSSKSQGKTLFLLDFSAAYDLMNWGKFLVKLRKAGIGGNLGRWMESWLKNRTIQVRVEGKLGKKANLHSGVAQGSKLSPLAFIFFTSCSTFQGLSGDFQAYADDTSYFLKVSTPEDVEIAQRDLDIIAKWSKDNGMRLNGAKCKVLSFGKHQVKADFFIEGQKLEYVEHQKHLGITLSTNLKFSEHHRKVIQTCNFLNQTARQATHVFRVNVAKQFYQCYIQSKMDYGSQIAYQPYASINKLYEDFFKKYWRFNDGRAPEGLLSPVQRFLFMDLVFLWKWRAGKFPALKFSDYFFERVVKPEDRASRSANLGIIVTKRYACLPRKFAFTVRTVFAWNMLPWYVRIDSKLESFKKAVKTIIMTNFKDGYGNVKWDESPRQETGQSQLMLTQS